MGSEQIKIKIAIIDETNNQSTFNNIRSNNLLEIQFYNNFHRFQELQSFKDLQSIIVRQSNINQQYTKNSINHRAMNLEQLDECFQFRQPTHQIPLLTKVINYIKKYSFERISIYSLVNDILNVKIPDFQLPYITMVTDKIQIISDHIISQQRSNAIINVQFERLMKDLNKRIIVKIIDKNISQEEQSINIKEWKKILKANNLSFEFYEDQDEFAKGLISTHSQYIIVNTSETLSKLSDIKKMRNFSSKIIYQGLESDVSKGLIQEDSRFNHKKFIIWAINDDRNEIVKIMKRCTDQVLDQQPIYSENTIVFAKNQYTTEQKQFIIVQIQQKLYKKYGKKYKNLNEKQSELSWIKRLNLRIVSNREKLKSHFEQAIFTFLITLDSSVSQIESIKRLIRKQKFQDRVYMYSVSEADQQQKKESLLNMQDTKFQLENKIQTIVKNASFKIKFEVGPIETLFTYKSYPKQIRYFNSKMGLRTTNIQNQKQFEQNYLSKSRKCFINSYHLVCRIQDYQDELQRYFDEQQANPQSYFRKLKIILYDSKNSIKEYYLNKRQNLDQRIVFMHFNITKVQDYIKNLYVPKVAVPFFIKKSLPNFYQAYLKIQNSKSKDISFVAAIVSNNQLLKQVFNDQNFKISHTYQLNFKKFSIGNRNSESEIQLFEKQYIKKYSILWRIGYQLIKNKTNNQGCISALKDDIKSALFKCLTYNIINVSDEDFDYFYNHRIDSCKTYIDLQITCIYIYSLPHGLNKAIEEIFKRPHLTCLTPKVFVPFLFTLLTNFCSFEDEVMTQKKLIVYIQDDTILKKVESLMIGDIFFNTGFLMCREVKANMQNSKHHCLIFQFQNIPFLSNSHIKNYLYIERFSFYKQYIEYLIAPFSKFLLKKKTLSNEGKYILTFTSNCNNPNNFISNIFKVNDFDEKLFFEAISHEINTIGNEKSIKSSYKQIAETKSLYKKAQMIGLYEQKLELVKSIKQGNLYKSFLNYLNKKLYLKSFSLLKEKERDRKSTTQIEANYFKTMLGIEKALVYFKLSEYDMGIKQLDRVLNYLKTQKQVDSDSWIVSKIQLFRSNLVKFSIKRQKFLNKGQKEKKWQIRVEENQKHKVVVKVKQESQVWQTGYINERQQFYLLNVNTKYAYFLFKTRTQFGQAPPDIFIEDIYQKKQVGKIKEENELEDGQDHDKFKYKEDKVNYVKKVYNKKQQKNEAIIKKEVEQCKKNDQLKFNGSNLQQEQDTLLNNTELNLIQQ